MSTTLLVGMADYKVGRTPDILMTAGLGSCIGICVYDLHTQIGSMGHIMLPSSRDNMKGNAAKYADTCLEIMIQELTRLGGNRLRLQAKMAGGAQMFSFNGKTPLLKIGERNAEAVQQELKKAKIPLLSYDVGGTYGRTINFDIKTGNLHIKTINHGEKVI